MATNDAIALKEKNGTAVASRPGMSAFFDSVRQPQEFVGDPRVIYDVATERFFVAAIGVRPGRCRALVVRYQREPQCAAGRSG